jgi:hypothetical protein
MQIKDLKELKHLLKLMRSSGVVSLKTPELDIQLSPDHLPKGVDNSPNLAEDVGEQWDQFPSGVLSPDQLIFYSSGGLPQDDPYKKD